MCLFICALWSPAGKGLTSWLSFVVPVVCRFPIGILGQVCYLIVWIPDICTLTFFENVYPSSFYKTLIASPHLHAHMNIKVVASVSTYLFHNAINALALHFNFDGNRCVVSTT